MKIPKKLQSVLWSTTIDFLNLKKDKYYIIHQVLIYGGMEELKWLFETYSKEEITDVFIHHPYRSYPRYLFYFVKNHLLDCKKKPLKEESYVTSIHGSIKQRTPLGFSET